MFQSQQSSIFISKSSWFIEGRMKWALLSSLNVSLIESTFLCIRLKTSLKEALSSFLSFFSTLFSSFSVFSFYSSFSSLIDLHLMSQFFWMQEQNLFFILFQGLPGSCLLISDHFRPIKQQSSIILRSYSSDQSYFLILGSSLLMKRSLICFPVLVPIISESSFQFLPTFFIIFLISSSSSGDQIFRFEPFCPMRLKRCRHWFQLRSFMSEAIVAHFLGCSQYKAISSLSSSRVQLLTLRILQVWHQLQVHHSLQLIWQNSTVSNLPWFIYRRNQLKQFQHPEFFFLNKIFARLTIITLQVQSTLYESIAHFLQKNDTLEMPISDSNVVRSWLQKRKCFELLKVLQQIRTDKKMLFIKKAVTLLIIKKHPKTLNRLPFSVFFGSLALTKVAFSFALFKKSWRDKEYAITEQIKKTVDSESLMEIIRRKGLTMNLVHLTAILDRMQEQQMTNTGEIVNFTVQRIRSFEQVFRMTHPEWIRTICNIICYLGNIKNTELNNLFRLVNFSQVLAKSKNIQKAMLITGLIRLGLFGDVFTFYEGKIDKVRIPLEDVVSDQFALNQILSIWFAIINQPKIISNDYFHSWFQFLINSQPEKDFISYRQYAYAAICYKIAYKYLKSPKNGRLYELVHYRMPATAVKTEYLLPHQLSLLLNALNTLRHDEMKNMKGFKADKIKTSGLQAILLKNFHEICSQKYTTLRHIANNFKLLNEMFKLQQETFLLIVSKIKVILKEQTELLTKQQNYIMNNKVDPLSLCSLTWKINQYFYQRRKQSPDCKSITEFNQKIAEFVVQLHKIGNFQKFTIQQLLMLYSGFFSYSKFVKPQFHADFKEISLNVVMKQGQGLTLKQYTLFYTYFKKMQFYSADFCRYIKGNVEILCSSSGPKHPTVQKINNEHKCIMDLNEGCLNCLSPKKDDSQSVTLGDSN